MRHAICYVSNVEENMGLEEIEALLTYCNEKNEAADIKGLLLYSEGNFFQVLEGEKQRVLEMFEKIKDDSRHHGIIQVIGRDIEQGSYDGFKVGVLKEKTKYTGEIPKVYIEALNGIPPEIKGAMERMLENFIATR